MVKPVTKLKTPTHTKHANKPKGDTKLHTMQNNKKVNGGYLARKNKLNPKLQEKKNQKLAAKHIQKAALEEIRRKNLEEKNERIKQFKKKRLERTKAISKKTQRGQPLMKDRMQYLLKQIQEMKRN